MCGTAFRRFFHNIQKHFNGGGRHNRVVFIYRCNRKMAAFRKEFIVVPYEGDVFGNVEAGRIQFSQQNQCGNIIRGKKSVNSPGNDEVFDDLPDFFPHREGISRRIQKGNEHILSLGIYAQKTSDPVLDGMILHIPVCQNCDPFPAGLPEILDGVPDARIYLKNDVGVVP